MSGRAGARPGGALRWGATALIALIGLALLAWPAARNLAYDREVAELRQQFAQPDGRTAAAEGWSRDDLYRYLLAENERLFDTGQAGLTDAFAYETVAVDLASYGIVDDRIGFLTIPAIGIDLPIRLGATRDHLKRGAVHLTQTSYPIGGPNTNAVIAAHRGSVVVMFRDLDKITPGDEIVVTNFRERLVYRAVESVIISPDDVDRITIVPGRDMITLLSCHPRGVNDQRIVLYAERET